MQQGKAPTTLGELIAKKTIQIASTLYVILIKDDSGNPTLVVDPGLDRPYSNRNKRVANYMAKKCGGEARTWGEAYKILEKAYPNLEKDLVARAEKAQLEKKYLLDHQKKNPGAGEIVT